MSNVRTAPPHRHIARDGASTAPATALGDHGPQVSSAPALSRSRAVLRTAGLDPALLAGVERRLLAAPGRAELAGPVLAHLLGAGGKRLRACLVLVATSLGRDVDPRRARTAAALVELVHAGTLLHDDVIDAAAVRRGAVAANARWGEATAVGAGTLAFARAADLAADLGPEATTLMARTLAALCEGEYLETVARRRDAVPSVSEYLLVVEHKTARLVAACCELGAIVGEAPAPVARALAVYGRWLGLAYQIVDDILDLVGAPEVTGKQRGADLRAGVVTLPVLLALERDGDGRLAALVARAPALGGDDIDAAVARTRAAGGIERARDVAARFARDAAAALDHVPPGPPRRALLDLARTAPERLR